MSAWLQKNIAVYFLIAALCAVTYSNGLDHGFFFDEVVFLGPGLQSYDDKAFFLSGFQGLYRPVAMVYLKFINGIFLENPVGYHAVNLALFIALGIFIFVLISRLSKNRELALLTACLYAVHPINNILVAFKACGYLTMSLLFMIFCILFFMRFLEENRDSSYCLGFIFFVLSLLSHEISCALPAYLACVAFFIYNKKLSEIFLWSLPYMAAIMLFVWVRSHIPDLRPIDTAFHVPMSLWSYTATIASLMHWYLANLVFPTQVLLVWNGLILTEGLVFLNIVFWGFWAACIYFIIAQRRQEKVMSWAMATFLVGFIPFGLASFVYVLQIGTAIIEPHWFGFSSIGFFVLAAYGLLFLKKKMPKKAWSALIVVLFLGLACMSRNLNELWKDDMVYCDYWLKINPVDPTAINWKARQAL
jgi:hypothetical protein